MSDHDGRGIDAGYHQSLTTAFPITVMMPSEYAVDPTGVGRVLGLTQMGEMKKTLAKEAAADAAAQPVAAPVVQAPVPVQPVAQEQVAAVPVTEPAAEPQPAVKSDEITVTLKPGEASEIKLEMLNKATVSFEWTTNGVPVNHDTHGEPYNGPKGCHCDQIDFTGPG